MEAKSYKLYLASAKRKKNERAGIHAWHPYYAGYSEAFVESALDHLCLPKDAIVLDPWCGSGTTQLVCAKRSIRSLGFDINPIMTFFTNAKSGGVVSFKATLEECLAAIRKNFSLQSISIEEDPLEDWMSESLSRILRSLLSNIRSMKFAPKLVQDIYPTLMKEDEQEAVVDVFSDFLTACLFVTGRELAKYSGGSNPTWTKAGASHAEFKPEEVLSKFIDRTRLMMTDVALIGIDPTTCNIALHGDSRKLPVASDSIDAIITSPPYLTRIDYAMSTQPEILLHASDEFLRTTRENTMGAPVIISERIIPQKEWGQLTNSILTQVANHPTKAAKSYYLKNKLQYFRDAYASLGEILRILKPEGKALVVVQSSYFKDVEIDLGHVYVEMSKNLGAKAKILSREVVKGHMAHVNSKSNEYKANKVYYEDVVEIQKI